MLAAAQQPAPASGRALSLDDAIRLAARESEVLQIARAGISRATGQVHIARSGYLPQVGGNLTYARALKSQFEALAGGGGPDTSTTPQPQSLCTPPLPDNPTPADRAAALAQATTCATPASLDFSRVGFGARNSWNFGISFRRRCSPAAACAGRTSPPPRLRRSAEVEFTSQRAQLALDVTQAYFDAVLADRLVALADTTLAQTEELLRQTSVARRVGNQSEFELLRATVTRDNQRPVNIAAPRRARHRLSAAEAAAEPSARRAAGAHHADRRAGHDHADHRRERVDRPGGALRREGGRPGGTTPAARHDDDGPRPGAAVPRGRPRAGRPASRRARGSLPDARADLRLPASLLPAELPPVAQPVLRELERGRAAHDVAVQRRTRERKHRGRRAPTSTKRAHGCSRPPSSPRSTRASRSLSCSRRRRHSPRAAARRSRRHARTRSTRSAIARESRRRRTSISRGSCSSRPR